MNREMSAKNPFLDEGKSVDEISVKLGYLNKNLIPKCVDETKGFIS